MKVVLDTKAASAYDDAISSRYHFPARYLRTVNAAIGDWAVFRRPRDGGEGMAYFGTGLIVDVVPDPRISGHYYARITDYLPFPTAVPWRVEGRYFERALRDVEDMSKIGLYLRGRSVRPLGLEDFVALVDMGLYEIMDPSNHLRYWGEAMVAEVPAAELDEARINRLVNRKVRDASFRKIVCEAYGDRCAVTRLRMINGGGRSEVQAAHIVPVAEGGPDIVQNGLALSATAHWLFDRHLISIDPDFRLLVAHNRVPTEYRSLLQPACVRLHLPKDDRLHPSEKYIQQHRERFASEA